MDLPNVYGPMAPAPATASPIWSNVGPQTWENIGGSWQGQEDGAKQTLLAAVRSLSTRIPSARLSFLDSVESGSAVNLPLDSALQSPAFLEKVGLDLDTTGARISQFKTLVRVLPQLLVPSGTPVSMTMGASEIPSQSPLWAAPVSYSPATDYKVDTRVSGRYISILLDSPNPVDFRFTGFDGEFRPGGAR
jgi:hypothetical protein